VTRILGNCFFKNILVKKKKYIAMIFHRKLSVFLRIFIENKLVDIGFASGLYW